MSKDNSNKSDISELLELSLNMMKDLNNNDYNIKYQDLLQFKTRKFVDL